MPIGSRFATTQRSWRLASKVEESRPSEREQEAVDTRNLIRSNIVFVAIDGIRPAAAAIMRIISIRVVKGSGVKPFHAGWSEGA